MLSFLINFNRIDSFLKHFLILFLCSYALKSIGQIPSNEASIDNLSQVGNKLKTSKKLDEALKIHFRVLTLRKQLFGEKSIPVANSLTNIGHCFYDKTVWDSAIVYYKKAIFIEENTPTLPPEQPFQIGDTYRCLSDCFIQKGDFLNAQTPILKALQWLKNDDGEKHAVAFNTQGQCLSYLGDTEGAIDAFKQAIQILPQSNINTWVFYTNLGDACIKRHDDRAIIYLKKALQSFPKQAQLSSKASLLNKLGDFYFDKSRLDSASFYYKNALNGLNKNTDKAIFSTCQINLTKVSRLKGELKQALQSSEWALKILNFKPDSVPQYPLETLIALTEYAKTLFDIALKNNKQTDWETALTAYEKAIKFGEQYEKTIQDAKSALILRGYFYERYGGAAEVCTYLGAFEKAYFEKALAYSEQGKAFLFKNKASNSFVSIGLKDIRNTLKRENEILLEYCFGRHGLLLFIISKNDFKVKILPSTGIQETIQRLHEDISTPYYSSQEHYFADEAVALYQQLISPAELPPSAPLTIVADGILHYLPFDILLKNKPQVAHLWQSYKSLYLINDHAISYRIAAYLPNAPKEKAANTFLGIAPIFEQHPKQLQYLKFNKEEVESIQSSWGGTTLIHSKAIKDNFINLSPQYQILHLSTHGIANDIYPDNSYLAFSLADSTDNGILIMDNIKNLDLHADLVVLSACRTATGTFYGGEGLMSIAHAFMSAGGRSVMASLWDVNEGATKNLMNLFYANLKKGMTKDEALRQAKLSLMSDSKDPITAHPYFWSAFTITGDIDSLEIPFNYMKWLIIGLISIGILCVFIYFIRLKYN